MRAYATLAAADGDWQIHYRELNETASTADATCVLLHPSPLASASMLPTMHALSKDMRCIAWDTPGYGMSDPLPATWRGADLQPYVQALRLFIEALGLQRPIIYGSATGAQIAIEFSKTAPDACGGLLLENVALFTDEEREQILDGYFPSVSPNDDGHHLETIWTMARESTRFFPWYSKESGADRRGAYPPADIITGVVRDYLQAGPDYDRAYRAAFLNERVEKLHDVSVETRIVLWEHGLLGEYSERLKQAALPAKMSLRHAGGGITNRMDVVAKSARELLALRNAN